MDDSFVATVLAGATKTQRKRRGARDIVLCLYLYIPAVWQALLIGQSMDNRLPELLQNLMMAMQTPLDMLTVAGGIVITFTKEILTLITGG